MLIDSINSPKDLKKLKTSQLPELASEIRQGLIKKLSVTGGHLGSNLGFIEATIALHYVFDFPVDKLVLDVSHQCYTHKILTGRKSSFLDPDHYNEYSGYTNPSESPYDLFAIGHTSTSVSLACGLARARDLLGTKENVIAVIGDGSLSGGEAFEGLDYAGGELKSNFIVVVNDNQMSIAEDHGAIYKNLRDLRESDGKCANNLFKALGYEYILVKAGNTIDKLLKVFTQVKDTDHPVLIHLCTNKGNGFEYALENKEWSHWVRPFDIKSGHEKNPFKGGERFDFIVRDHLEELMKTDNQIALVNSAVPGALSFTHEHRQKLGKRFSDVGICEEHAIAMSAGMAKRGLKPIFFTLGTFYQRAYDQISQEICINNLPVTMIVVDASIYASKDITHLGIFALGLLSNIPNLTVLCPANKEEYLGMLDWSINQKNGSVAIFAPRGGVFHCNYLNDPKYKEWTKSIEVVKGSIVAIFGLGDFFQLAEDVAGKIKEKFGFQPTLVNPRCASALDTELLDKIAPKHQIVITYEDGIIDGGYGQKVASYLGKYKDVRVFNYGFKKEFFNRVDLDELFRINHLSEYSDIYNEITNL